MRSDWKIHRNSWLQHMMYDPGHLSWHVCLSCSVTLEGCTCYSPAARIKWDKASTALPSTQSSLEYVCNKLMIIVRGGIFIFTCFDGAWMKLQSLLPWRFMHVTTRGGRDPPGLPGVLCKTFNCLPSFLLYHELYSNKTTCLFPIAPSFLHNSLWQHAFQSWFLQIPMHFLAE